MICSLDCKQKQRFCVNFERIVHASRLSSITYSTDMKLFNIAIATASLSVLFACSSSSTPSNETGTEQQAAAETAIPAKDLSKFHRAYFASGCFWCVEAVFESVEGVEEVISGYSGGEKQNPTYQEVSSGSLRHAEAVEVYYDSSKVDYPTLLKVFFGSHDPTTPNRQGPDRGPQYRSMIFYQNPAEKELADAYIQKLNESGDLPGPIVTEVEAFKKFWPAEDYHQNYERLHPDQPYVKNVSIPRLRKFQKAYPELLKEGH